LAVRRVAAALRTGRAPARDPGLPGRSVRPPAGRPRRTGRPCGHRSYRVPRRGRWGGPFPTPGRVRVLYAGSTWPNPRAPSSARWRQGVAPPRCVLGSPWTRRPPG